MLDSLVCFATAIFRPAVAVDVAEVNVATAELSERGPDGIE